MQLRTAHLLGVFHYWYLKISASGTSKTSFLRQKWQKFQTSFLRFKDVINRRQPKDVPPAAAYFMYQPLNYWMNISGLNWGNHLAQTRTEPGRSAFSCNRYTRNGPKTDPLLTLLSMDFDSHDLFSHRSFGGPDIQQVTIQLGLDSNIWKLRPL
jgi:hypothetical protein